MSRPAILITAADLAPQALALLADYEIVYAGKTPTEDDIVALCRQHNPVAIIVRYSKVGAAAYSSTVIVQISAELRRSRLPAEAWWTPWPVRQWK